MINFTNNQWKNIFFQHDIVNNKEMSSPEEIRMCILNFLFVKAVVE